MNKIVPKNHSISIRNIHSALSMIKDIHWMTKVLDIVKECVIICNFM